MKLRTVLKVGIYCQECKKDVMKDVSRLTGIDEVKVDREDGTVTVVGEVDPVLLTETLRKGGWYAAIVSVGPPQPPLEPNPPSRIENQPVPQPPEPNSSPGFPNFPPSSSIENLQLAPVGHAPSDNGSCPFL